MNKNCNCSEEPFNSCVCQEPKFKKPGPKKKKVKKTSRSKVREIEQPEDKHCRVCNVKTGTECYRHVESRLIKFVFGGGITGGKLPDKLTAWACSECDAKLSVPLDKNASMEELLNHAFNWYTAISKTWLI